MKRIIAVFFLISYLNLIFYPTASWAISVTGVQPEYMGFGSLTSNEMVDLFTGDMSLNIPLLHIPGPEGGYSLPLSYNAGISPEQEASWVGLGWSLNAGSINREAVQYPDDYKGQEIVTKFYMPKQRISTNIQLFLLEGGNAYLSSGLNGTKFGATIEDVLGNSIGLFDANGNASALGIINYNKDQSGRGFASYEVDPVGIVNQAMTALSIFTFGVSIAVKVAGKTISGSLKAAQSIAKVANVITTAYSAAMLIQTLAEVLKGTKSSSEIGNEVPIKSFSGCTDVVPTLLLGFNLRQCVSELEIDHTRTTKAYGTLYLGNEDKVNDNETEITRKILLNNNEITLKRYTTSTSSRPASDIFQHVEDSEYSNERNANPIFIAKDQFIVQGEGVSGRIEPTKLETGDVSMPFQRSGYRNLSISPMLSDYKAQFRYPGSLSNYYNFNDLKYESNDNTKLKSGIEVDFKRGDNWADQFETFSNEFTITDPQLSNQENISPSRNGFYSSNQNLEKNKLALNKHINWFTNAEISSFNPTISSTNTNLMLNSGYIDFLPQSQRASFRNGKPADGIGGFTITREDGLTYHYTLPVYKNVEVNFSSRENPFHTGLSYIDIMQGFSYQKADPINMISVNNNPYAVSWLLTAVTGSDFVDRGELGIIDDQDFGYWVKFEYGMFSDKYAGRVPYSINDPEYVLKSVDNVFKSYADNKSEIYYLDAIRTRSHIALFSKSLREDCSGINVELSNGSKSTVPTLRLDNIYLLTNMDFEVLQSLGFSKSTGSNQVSPLYLLNSLFDKDDFSGSVISNFLKNKALRKINFSFDYSLCKGVPNNLDKLTVDEGTGKLTLNKVSVLGKGETPIHPDYDFSYSNNPDYNFEIDAWGLYSKNNALTAKISKQIYPSKPRNEEGVYNQNTSSYLTTGTKPSGYKINDFDAAAWSLDKITMPNGVETEFIYERDSYSSIAGVPISTYYSGETTRYGGGIRVAQISTKDPITQVHQMMTYNYTNEDGTTSGVASVEPEVIAKDFYAANTDKTSDNYKKYTLNKIYFTFPNLPITYKRVEVFNGLPVFGNYLNKTVNTYVTLNQDEMFSNEIGTSKSKFVVDPLNIFDIDGNWIDQKRITRNFHNRVYKTSTKISDIGRLKRKEIFDKSGNSVFSQIFTYGDFTINSLPAGVFQENIFSFVENFNSDLTFMEYVLNRTLNKEVSSYLSSITTTKQGVTTQITFSDFDLITGMPKVSILRDSYGNNVKVKNELAYNKFPQMGSKAENQTNKNMLSQEYGVYNFLLDQNGNEHKLLDARITTYANDIKVLSANGSSYGTQSNVWRQKSNYVWIGNNNSAASNDGTYDLVTFNSNMNSLTDDTKWQKLDETILVDSYSHLLDIKDINGNSQATLYDPMGKFAITSASNASYDELAFSGAETITNSSSEGNVQNVNGVLTNSHLYAHTGKKSLMIDPGKEGFRFKLKAGKFTSNKKYRANVWVYFPGIAENNLGGTELYFEQGSNKGKVNAVSGRKAGNWYLMEILFSLPSNTTDVTIGVRSLNSQVRSVYVDDFRVAPLASQVKSFIVDSDDFTILAELDNDHLYTRYEFDVAGRVVNSFAERIGKPIEQRLVSKRYNLVK